MTHTRLAVGFMPLLDCAPLVAAVEKGYAADEGLTLDLVRETSWANIRDRLIIGQFTAAHMLGPMPIAATLGLGARKASMIAPMALGLGGNAITVSTSLWEMMRAEVPANSPDPLTRGHALRSIVHSRAMQGAPPLTLAVVYPFSAHHYELRYWLAACGIDPDEDVTLIVIPPPFMVDALRSGQIDGFCAGEPWNSLAVAADVGRIILPTTAIWPHSPEKVLGLRADWAAEHNAEVAALIRAVYRATEWCARRESLPELAALLAQPGYVGESAAIIERGLAGRLNVAADATTDADATAGPTRAAPALADFLVFDGPHHATFPRTTHALWFYSQMVRWRQVTASSSAEAAVRTTYRPDLYRQALAPLNVALPSMNFAIEHPGTPVTDFFDGRVFDPDDIAGYITR